ncbi:restriction endonuclease [Sphingobium chungbukense]|uniref:restriction endonuclease n=1 Tax=Sphingobium chungbukense TaxID=56193 RepID=UPI000629372B|nr:hypothetical protein [Sphingobium chungbukense]
MRTIGDTILFSATDLMRFVGCAHATALDLAYMRGEPLTPREDTEDAALLQKQGDAHEAAHLEKLKDAGNGVVEIARGDLAQNADETRAALAQGSQIIFQGAFLAERWGGWSDFLERVEQPSLLGPFSYEVTDTKLKRKAHPKHVLQLVLYSDLLAEIQSVMPEHAHVQLGNGARATLRLADYAHYHNAKTAGTLAELPDELKPYADQVFQLIDSVFSDAQLPKVGDGRKPKTNPLNANFDKKEFQELWARINRKAVYRVEFDSAELVRKCVSALESQLRVRPLQYTIQEGVQNDGLRDDQLRAGDGFTITNTTTEQGGSIHSLVKYDLVGKVAENAQLTRDTAATILGQTQPAVFGQFKMNPEHFISEASRIITEQKAAMVIERLIYDEVDERYDVDIFTANQTGQDFSRASAKLKNHVYDYAITHSDVEREFVKELDTSSEVVVYAKLPRGFLIPTPVGDYNPDWAISFKAGSVRYIYFVAETKGTMSSMKLREIEKTKIECARKFFDEISQQISEDHVKYEVVTDCGKLMEIVGVN